MILTLNQKRKRKRRKKRRIRIRGRARMSLIGWRMKGEIYIILLHYISAKLSFIIKKTLNVTSFVSEISISIFDV